MKIALCNNVAYQYATSDPRACGGAEKFQWLLARALVAAGWSVVVGVGGHLLPGQEEVVDGVRFLGMPAGHLLAALPRFLASEKPDWWFWRGADPLWGALVLIAKRQGVRGIFSAAFDWDVLPQIALTRRQRWWPLYSWGLNSVDRIFVQHAGQFSGLNQKLQKKAAVLPGLVALRDSVTPRAARGNYVVWVAVLRQHKRPDLLIEMARKSPDVNYVVCGATTTHRTPEGYGEKIVAELRSLPNIEYLAHVEPARCLEIIARAQAFVSTSDQEGFPNTFLEAWSSGTPVVSRSIDPDGVIIRNGLGFVSGTDEQAVCDIRKLLNSPEVFDAISSRARKYVELMHTGSAVTNVFNKTILPLS